MKRFTLTAACLIAAATPAYAANWTVLHAGRAACITGAEAGRLFGTPSPLSPFLLERLERSDDNFATTDVHRGPANEIEWGEVTSLKHITIAFFSIPAGCQTMLKVMLDNGMLNDPNELK